MSINDDTVRKLPGANYNIAPALDILKFEQGVYKTEFLERLKLCFGASYSDGNSYGIVSDSNPRSDSETTPFLVAVNLSQPLQVDVYSGIGITPNGHRIVITSNVQGITFSDIELSNIYVVFLEYSVQDGTRSIDRFNSLAPVSYLEQESSLSYIKTLTVSEFLDTSIVTQARRDHIIALAVVTITSDELGALAVSIDLTDINYSWNRPWFSLIDIQHRTSVGSATPTSSNAHGLTHNDILATDEETIYSLLRGNGVILALDREIAKVPGTLGTQTISASNFLTDNDGYITNRQGSLYTKLNHYPLRLGEVKSSGYAISGEYKDNLLIISPYEAPLSSSVICKYMYASAYEPPRDVGSRYLTFGSVAENEVVISNGVKVNPGSYTINMSDAGNIPQYYQILLDGNGQLIKTPQILLPASRVLDLGLSSVAVNVSLLGDSTISIGLTGTSPSPTLVLKIRIEGKNSSGTDIYEVLEFNSTWSDTSSIRGTVNSSQFKTTSNVFSSVSRIRVTQRSGTQSTASIIIYANANPYMSYQLAKYLTIATCIWDGSVVYSISDNRRVISSYQQDTYALTHSSTWGIEGAMRSASIMFPGIEHVSVFGDDFSNPLYSDLYHTKLRRCDTGISLQLPDLKYHSRAFEIPVEGCYDAELFLHGLPMVERFRYYASNRPTVYLYYKKYGDNSWHFHNWTPDDNLNYKLTVLDYSFRAVYIVIFNCTCSGFSLMFHS